MKLKEAEMLIEMLREENRDLRDAADAKERELTELRSKYAELILRTDRQINEISALQLSASHLVRSASGNVSEENTPAVEMLDTLALVQKEQQQLLLAIERHAGKIRAVMDTVAPSQALRKEVDDDLKELQNEAQKCTAPLTMLTAASGITSSCAIIKADTATGIVILDQGTLHGLRNGAEYILQRGEQIAARLKVIESRPLHSAAMIIAGDTAAAVPGTLLKRAEE